MKSEQDSDNGKHIKADLVELWTIHFAIQHFFVDNDNDALIDWFGSLNLSRVWKRRFEKSKYENDIEWLKMNEIKWKREDEVESTEEVHTKR